MLPFMSRGYSYAVLMKKMHETLLRYMDLAQKPDDSDHNYINQVIWQLPILSLMSSAIFFYENLMPWRQS